MASFVSVLKLSLINGSVLLLTDYVIKETFAANLRNFPQCSAHAFDTSQNITAGYEAKSRPLDRCSGNAVLLYSEVPRFEFLPGRRLFCLRFFVVFLVSPGKF
jgi:hypothetical protein